jgi:hypothetical protein
MASDKFFGTFFPQAGDSLTQIMSRMLGRMVRPSEAEVNLLASAARLGTTLTQLWKRSLDVWGLLTMVSLQKTGSRGSSETAFSSKTGLSMRASGM